MRLDELIAGLPMRVAHGPAAVPVAEVWDDSRQVRPLPAGGVFLARAGARDDGRRFIEDAVARGADVVVAADTPTQPPSRPDGRPLTWVHAAQVDQALAGQLAERLLGHPARRLRLIGITGTNGKTTTSLIAAHLLRSAGLACGVIGTVFVDDGRERTASSLTTPGAIELSRHLARMVRHGCAAAVLEVSSHALEQGRTAALDFEVGLFTNLTGDHLDYHPTMQAYAAAKARLFHALRPEAWAVVNADDPHAPTMLEGCRARPRRCTLEPGPDAGPDRCVAQVLDQSADHSLARFDGPWGTLTVRLPLVGRHNVANTLYALAAAHAVSGSTRGLRAALEQCPSAPGRLEPVPGPGGGPRVLVDYAHTHDALGHALGTLRPLTAGRLIVLFGCGGDRDRTKRPRMAAVACALADRVIITSDNPRSEEPQAIIQDILAGVPAGAAVHVEPDRARAIELAIGEAEPADTVLLAGKGHESYQLVGAVRLHFDDREQAAAALRRRSGV